jgi:hypothetical protein
MPSLTFDFLNELQENFRDFPIFIETGTYIGETIFSMESLFNKLYTIEINEELYTNTKSRYRGNKIHFIFGDSSDEIKNVLEECDNKVLFFLDGHYSGGNTGNFKITTLYTPLEKELENINKYCKHESLIIIDDCRDLGTKNNSSWEYITEPVIRYILKDRLVNLYYRDCENHKNDRMIIHIKGL